MKQLFWGIVAASVLFGAGCAGLMTTVVGAADTDMFTITNFEATYQLGRDAEQRSTLEATWRITADFPHGQNRGLAPLFVTTYAGHPTDFRLRSVTDENGAALEHQWQGNELRIGNKHTYVSGRKTYVISYTQRDVTRRYGSTGRDEFYWDVIGHQWRVPISQATVRVQLDESLIAARRGQAVCYRGTYDSNSRCADIADNRNEVLISDTLQRREGMTAALGFAPGTFAPYKKPFLQQLTEWWTKLQLVLIPVTAALIFLSAWLWRRMAGRQRQLKPIAPEYLPPKHYSVSVVGDVLRHYGRCKGSPLVAQLLDLAVRRYVRLYEVRPASFLRNAEYRLEVTKDLRKLRAEEREVIRDMFGDKLPEVGDKLNLKTLRNDTAYAYRTMDDAKKLRRRMREDYGLYEKNQLHRRRMRQWALASLLLTVLCLSPPLLLLTLVLFGLSFGWSLTDEGLQLRRYVAGLKQYIGVAEAERLRLLQSPEGAEKVKIDPTDSTQLVKLYEKVLPYAVLFGQEKAWTKQLGAYYEQVGATPDWYSGQGAFNAAAFATGMSQLSSAATAVNSSSSSTGGSTGGGFVGGGGGGGGGGGW